MSSVGWANFHLRRPWHGPSGARTISRKTPVYCWLCSTLGAWWRARWMNADSSGRTWSVCLPIRQTTQHSHRLGVHPAWRQQHLGEHLKRFQREWCLEHGIQHVRWTFDPLLLVNAHLNVHRLGAVVRTFLPNYYGEMGGINAGAPSDRFEAEWHLESERTAAHLAGKPSEIWPEQALHPLQNSLPDTLPDTLAVQLPPDFYRLLREDNLSALEWRRKTGPLFTRLFEGGHVLTDVNLSRQQYLFERGAVY